MERAMRLAINEIQSLRRRNEILEAKVQTMDALTLLFVSHPAYPSQGMSEDVVWLLQKELDALPKPKPDHPPEPAAAFETAAAERG